MAPRKEWNDDDGRTIADMSDVGRSGFFVPKTRGRKSSAEQRFNTLQPEAKEQASNERYWENESEFTPRERRMYVLGALKAALLIAFAFIAGLGVAVWLMIQIWT